MNPTAGLSTIPLALLASILLALLASGPFAFADPPAGPVMTVHEDDDGVTVLEAGNPVLHYQRSTRSLAGQWPRANYVHPLYDLSGQVITEDFPEDHRHHRGVFWAWHQTWVGQQRVGDAWVCKDFVWEVTDVATTSDPKSITIEAVVQWKSPLFRDDRGEMRPIARERVVITTHASGKDHRLIDFDISLKALVDDVKIGGSEDVKGYGGFSPRIVLSDQTRFRSAQGTVEPIKTAVRAGEWIDITSPDDGVAVLSHRSNPAPRDRFILRRKRSMQNAVFPGREPVALSRDEPTRLRYRLVIHRGDLTIERLGQLQSEYE